MTNIYNSTDIRTSNMLPDRSSDVHFDPDERLEDVSLTQQQFADECDINNIIRRNPDGLYSHLNPNLPNWGADVTGVLDYQDAMNVVASANEAFASLDARVRARFANDPANLLAFLEDPQNRSEAISLGLVNPPAPEPVTTSTTVDKTPEKPSDAA